MEAINNLSYRHPSKTSLKVALVGNPNSGKSTLFNALTGLNQKTGNFPGVTVDKKTGFFKIDNNTGVELIDLPGIYSLYPKSLDEKVAYEVLCDEENVDHPDVVVCVADANNLKRNLFLVSQLIDLKLPVILVLNMMDIVHKEQKEIDTTILAEQLGVKIISISARQKEGIVQLKKAFQEEVSPPSQNFIDVTAIAPEVIDRLALEIRDKNSFYLFQAVCNNKVAERGSQKRSEKNVLQRVATNLDIDINQMQSSESVERYKKINYIIALCLKQNAEVNINTFTHRLDGVLTHRVWGYVAFLCILFFIFESLFYLAAFPTEWIEHLFAQVTNYAASHLPSGELSDLFVNGILAGIGGIVVFVPQIALLFAFIALFEDTGYMARVSFIMDKLLRKFGLNGRSIIPLISGVACAIPAIMSTRTIGNRKERLITIMVTPLMSCSARLPIYTLLISMVVPKSSGFFNYQGLVLMSLYLVGFVAAISAAFAMKYVIKSEEKSYFIMELPLYRTPQLKTVLFAVWEKVKVFLFDAGKIILAIAVILWFLASHAPDGRFEEIEKKYRQQTESSGLERESLTTKMASEKLEVSYAGIIGKSIEPAIKPLGFDWKIGIALITSFAAREVFVGSMATIYSVGDAENTRSIGDKMKAERDADTGKPKFTVATGFSLLLFYAFAMQCMSTLVVVYHETKSWKWPVIQFLYMGALAYFSALIVFQVFG